MSVSIPNPSTRLLRAATAEQADLGRHRERLTLKREALLAQVRQVDDALAIVDQRLSALGRVVEVHDPDPAPAGVIELTAPVEPPESRVLRGPAIRELAVQVLIEQPERVEAVHYRRWYELVQRAGYSIAGKDPLAVFLTQVSRSPVVRKATEPGVYEVDRQAPLRIRRRLERLQSELRELTVAGEGPVELAEARARRHELDVAISQQERALEETLRVLRLAEGPSGPAANRGPRPRSPGAAA
jgi:hypothetical protein